MKPFDPAPRPRTLLGHLEHLLLGVGEVPFEDLAASNEWAPTPLDACCPSCARPVGPGPTHSDDSEDGQRCTSCREESIPWSRAVCLGPFEGALREGLHAAKYRGSRASAAQIGQRLGKAIAEAISVDGSIAPASTLLVPVPSTFRRRMARGIDHVEIMASAASRASGIRIGRLLSRSHRASQVSLPATKRWSNIRGCMRVRRFPGPDIRALIVVDDLRTTGSTLRDACRALRESGAVGRVGTRSGEAGRSIWCAFSASASETMSS